MGIHITNLVQKSPGKRPLDEIKVLKMAQQPYLKGQRRLLR
jgi:hypothetical protein